MHICYHIGCSLFCRWVNSDLGLHWISKEFNICIYFKSISGSLLSSCLYYVVYSLYKFIRSGCIDDDYMNNVTDIELLDRTHKDMLDHDPYYDHDPDQPSTSYHWISIRNAFMLLLWTLAKYTLKIHRQSAN